MDNTLDRLLQDLPWQFRERERITALYEVLAEEFEEIRAFFEGLRDRRHVGVAEGAQLDGVGDIVVLSRAEAGLLAGKPIPFDVIDDERYRTYLHYKIFKNTSTCTYRDVMKSVRMFWDGELYYTEDPAVPATMIFNTPILPPDADVPALLKAPLIRAAGVTLLLTATTETPEESTGLHVTGALGGSHMETGLPLYIPEMECTASISITGGFQSVMTTDLPQMERSEAVG